MRALVNMMGLAFSVLLLGCCGEMATKRGHSNNSDAVVVEFLLPVPSLTFVTMDPVQVEKTVAWLERARATQLPGNKMGGVAAWCKITLLKFQGTRRVSATSIYSTIDGQTELLTPKQRGELLDVFDLEEMRTEPYIKRHSD